MALSPDEKTLYVADYLNHAIRALDLGSRQVTTLAGNGTAGFSNGAGDKAQFNQPYNVKADANGRLYVPDQNNHAIRRVDPDGTVSTVAGNGQSGFADGKPSDARFNNPTGLGVAADGTIYVADRNNHRIRAISPAGEITTIAGDGTAGQQDGPGQVAKFNRPIDLVLTTDGALVVSEENNHRLRKILPPWRSPLRSPRRTYSFVGDLPANEGTSSACEANTHCGYAALPNGGDCHGRPYSEVRDGHRWRDPERLDRDQDGQGEPKWTIEQDQTAPSKSKVVKQSSRATYPLLLKE